jgi:hypothetical protein
MRIINLLFFLSFIAKSYGQDFGGDKVGLGNFVHRIYNAKPFNGVKLFQTQDGQDYMISVVELKNDPGKTEAVQSRIASVKAKAYVSQYLNGSNISTDVIVITMEEKTKDSVISRTEMQEILRESSYGFVDGVEMLTKFESNSGKELIYIYYREIKKK